MPRESYHGPLRRDTNFQQEDILHLVISEGAEAQSVELSLNITAELDDKGELIGIEILHASEFLRDTTVECAQAKLRRMPRATSA